MGCRVESFFIAGKAVVNKGEWQKFGEMFSDIGKGIANAFGGNFQKSQNFKYKNTTTLANADTGFTKFDVYSGLIGGRTPVLKGMKITASDGRSIGPKGATAGLKKTSWTCPAGQVMVGATPRVDIKHDLASVSFTCGNPAANPSTPA